MIEQPQKKKEFKPAFVPKIIVNNNLLNTSSTKQTRYEVGDLLGRGGFAECFKVVNMETNKQYALKVINKSSDYMQKSGAVFRLNNQIEIMRSLKHENISKYIQSFDDEFNYYIVIEFYKKISLNEMIKQRGALLQVQVKYFIKQLVKVAKYLKQVGIIHRDIKTPNIFLDQNLVVKLGDFGLAIHANLKNSFRYITCGTLCYMAPQIVEKQRKYSFQIDMWCIGVVTFCLLYSCHPFVAKTTALTEQKIKSLRYQFPKKSRHPVSVAAKNFITKIFQINPKMRLTPEQALQHEFLTQSVPYRLPTQSYKNQLPLRTLLQYCKPQKNIQSSSVNSFKKVKNNQKIYNKTLTSYFFKKVSQEKTEKQKRQNPIRQNLIIKNQQKKEQHIFDFKVKIKSEHQLNNHEHNPEKQQQILKKQIIEQVQQKPGQLGQLNQQQNKSISKKQCKIYKRQESEYFQQQYYEQPQQTQIKKQQFLKLQQQQEYTVYKYLQQKLNNQPYVFRFLDFSSKFGMCMHLSNNVKIISFNDTTVMAIYQDTKQVVYVWIQQIDQNWTKDINSQNIKQLDKSCLKAQQKSQFQQKYGIQNRVLYEFNKTVNTDNSCSYKFVKVSSDNQNVHNQNIQITNVKSNKKTKKHFKSLQFKTFDPPKNLQITKKYFALRQYCKYCAKINSQSALQKQIKIQYKYSQNVNLLSCAKLIYKWGIKPKPHSESYIFMSRNFSQIFFPDDSIYFVNKQKTQIIIINEKQKIMKSMNLPIRRKKQVTKKQGEQIQIVSKFIKHFVDLRKNVKRQHN